MTAEELFPLFLIFLAVSLCFGYEAYRGLIKQELDFPLGTILGALIGAEIGYFFEVSYLAIVGAFIGGYMIKPKKMRGSNARVMGAICALLALGFIFYDIWFLSLAL